MALETSRFTTDELWRVCTLYAGHAMVCETITLELHAGVPTRMLVNEEDRRGSMDSQDPPPGSAPEISILILS